MTSLMYITFILWLSKEYKNSLFHFEPYVPNFSNNKFALARYSSDYDVTLLLFIYLFCYFL